MNPMTPAEYANWWWKFWWGWYVGTVNAAHRNWEEAWKLR